MAGGLGATTLYMLDGSAQQTFGGHTYLGEDPGRQLRDPGPGSASRSPRRWGKARPPSRPAFFGLTGPAIQQLCAPETQGQTCNIYFGFWVNPLTGAVISSPVLWFAGIVDTGSIQVDQNSKSVDINVVAQSEWLFLNNDGAKLNSSWHQSFFPTETGFAFVDNVSHQLPWGMNGPRPDQVTDIANYDYGPSAQPITNGLG